MKRMTAILAAALLLAGLAFGCNRGDPDAVQLTEPATDSYELWTTVTLPETEPESVEPTDPDPLESSQTTTTKKTTTTAAKTTTSKIPTASAATTTTRSATTDSTEKTYAGGMSISGKEAALEAFNGAVKKAVDGKAGFNKNHMITPQDWVFDQDFLGELPDLGGLGLLIDPASMLSGALNSALGKGMRTSTTQKGSGNSLIKSSSLSMGDLKDVTYTGSAGSGYTVTLLVKDGETRQQKQLFGNNKSTGSSPMDKGPLYQITNSGGLYDHMDADKIFALVKSAFAAFKVEPIDIYESTSQVKFTAKLDGQGRLTYLQATYNQTINLKDIRVLNGLKSYKDNKGSSTVTVTYDAFMY